MAYPLDIPIELWVKIDDQKPIQLGTGGIPWPYDARATLAELLSDAAEELRKPVD